MQDFDCLILCLPPPKPSMADCYLCFREISLASPDPLLGPLNLYLEPWQRGTPKLLVLITQRDSWPDSGMWSPLGFSASMSEDESLPLLPALKCAVHTPALVMSVRFCSAPDHTRARINTASHTNAGTHFQTPTDTLVINCSHSDIQPPMYRDNFSTPPPQRSETMKSGIWEADLLMALVTTSDFASLALSRSSFPSLIGHVRTV